MSPITQWTYSMTVSRADDLVDIEIQTVPQVIAQRRRIEGPAYQWHSQCPGAPRISCVPLPGHADLRLQTPNLFPINLSQRELPPLQTLYLSEHIPPYTIILVEDPFHNVLFRVKTAYTAMTAADFVNFLQFLYQSELPMYTRMLPSAHQSGRTRFISRHALNERATSRAFAAGTRSLDVQTGKDLLREKTNLWMLGPNADNSLVAMVDVPRETPDTAMVRC
ncbi:hypothetical protein DFH06DRAFT_1197893 [Mycena polygramma]|nr:hypothetical protein DFH06DRAFT_1197893 [Mycena polygramma]